MYMNLFKFDNFFNNEKNNVYNIIYVYAYVILSRHKFISFLRFYLRVNYMVKNFKKSPNNTIF